MKKKATFIVILAMIIQAGAVVGMSANQESSEQLSSKNLSDHNPPKEVWNKTYGGDNNVFVNAVNKTSDGGVVMAGSHTPKGGGDEEAWLVKVDENGKLQWKNQYSTPTTTTQFRDVIQTSDGGYLAVGEGVNSSQNGYLYSAYIVKTDSQGKEVWNRTIRRNGNYTTAFSAIETPDGYVVTGYAYIGGAGAWLMKMDDDGNTVWTNSYGTGNWVSEDVVKADNGYIAAGNNYTNSDRENFWLKTDKSGNLVWKKPLNTTTSTTINDLSDAGNGKYAFTGHRPVSNKSDDVWFGVINDNGNIQWNKTIGGSNRELSEGIINTDKGYAIIGSTLSYGVSPNRNNLWLATVDKNGNERWNTTFGGTDFDSGVDLVKDKDSFYLAGGTDSYGGEPSNLWLVKAAPPKPPTADFTYSPSTVTRNKKVTFNATSSSDPNNDIVSYEWDFEGDGNTDATGKTVKHTYSKNGTYEAILTVTDSEGATDETTKIIKVTNTLSIEEVIANLNTENDIVNFPELQEAIGYWVQEIEVPNTGGKKISFSKLQELISLWVQEKKV